MSSREMVELTRKHTLFEWSAQGSVDPSPGAGAKGCWFWTPEGKRFEPEQLIVGSPAAAKRALTAEQVAGLRRAADSYVQRAARYRAELVRIG